jgi:hypothetical protein
VVVKRRAEKRREDTGWRRNVVMKKAKERDCNAK